MHIICIDNSIHIFFQAASINTFDTADTHLQEQPNVSPELSGPRCKAIHDYISPEANDLSFKAGTIITLLENCGGEWYRGELYGVSGMFPATFVEIVEDLPVESYKKPEQTESVYLKESDSVQNEQVEERSEFSHRVEEDHVIKGKDVLLFSKMGIISFESKYILNFPFSKVKPDGFYILKIGIALLIIRDVMYWRYFLR